MNWLTPDAKGVVPFLRASLLEEELQVLQASQPLLLVLRQTYLLFLTSLRPWPFRDRNKADGKQKIWCGLCSVSTVLRVSTDRPA